MCVCVRVCEKGGVKKLGEKQSETPKINKNAFFRGGGGANRISSS